MIVVDLWQPDLKNPRSYLVRFVHREYPLKEDRES